MAISFVCICGKHLRARDNMAGRRSMCPRCGAPVGVPALRAFPPGAPTGPLTPAERLRTRRVVLPGDEAYEQARAAVASRMAEASPPPGVRPAPAGSDVYHQPRLQQPLRRHSPKPQRARGDPRFEISTGECFFYPLRALRQVVPQALLLMALSMSVVGLWERLPDLDVDPLTSWLLYMICLGAPLAGLAWAGGFLECVLAASAAGEVRTVPRLRDALGRTVGGAATWLFAFLAGPVVLVAAAYFYWLYCGDPAWVDRLILAELIGLAAGYWLLAVAAAGRGDGLLDANPVRVADLIEGVGKGVAAIGVAAGVIALGAGWLFWTGAEAMSDRTGRAALLFFVAWLGGLLGGAFLMSLLGVWCYRRGR